MEAKTVRFLYSQRCKGRDVGGEMSTAKEVCPCVVSELFQKDACAACSALAGSYESIALICQLSALIQLITIMSLGV